MNSINWGGRIFTAPTPFTQIQLLPPPPSAGGVYLISTLDYDWRPLPHRPIYCGETGSFRERCNVRHEHYQDWLRAASGLIYISFLYAATESDRRAVERDLIAQYSPPCNTLGVLGLRIRDLFSDRTSSTPFSISDLLKKK
jgi:hypothetical protein